MKDTYNENCWKKFKKDKNRKMSHVHRLEELILQKCPYYPRPPIDATNKISIKIPIAFFTKTKQKNP